MRCAVSQASVSAPPCNSAASRSSNGQLPESERLRYSISSPMRRANLVEVALVVVVPESGDELLNLGQADLVAHDAAVNLARCPWHYW